MVTKLLSKENKSTTLNASLTVINSSVSALEPLSVTSDTLSTISIIFYKINLLINLYY